jgi:polyhydroxybutyrate depolymerase
MRLGVYGALVIAACWHPANAEADTCGPIAPGGRATCTIEVGGRTREYRIIVPASAKAPAPLVLNLHGRKGTAEEQEPRLAPQAEREGFVLVSPQGVERSWNAGVGFGPAHEQGIDDVAFIRAVVDDASRVTSIDRARVYAAGLSNGARMVHRLACEASDVFSAIASVAGPIADRNEETGERAFTCKPPRAVPVMMIHGTSDLCTPYAGGQGLDTKGNVATPAAAAEWVSRDACTTASTVKLGSTTCEVHGGCADGAEVALCTIENGGHVWPGSPKFDMWRGCGGVWPDDFRASDEMWAFFVAHPMPSAGATKTWQPAPVESSDEPGTGLELAPVDTVDLPFDHSTISLGLRGTGPSDFDAAGDYRSGSVALSGALSLYSRLHVAPHDAHLVRVMLQYRIEGERVQADMFARDQQVTKAGLGLTAVYVAPSLNMYAVYAGAAIAESREALSSPSLMPTAIALGTYHTSKRLALIYGGGFGYALGRPWLLPAAGLSWTPSRTWNVSMILPIFATVKHKLTRKLSADALLAVSGDRFGIANEGAFAGSGDDLRVEVGEARLGLGMAYRWTKHWSVRGELGFLGPRRLRVVDAGTTVMSADSKGAGYLSTAIIYGFGNAPL